MNPYASYDLLGSITVLLVIPCFHLTLSNFTRPRCKSQRAALPAMIDVHPSQRYHSREIVICKQGEIYWQSNPSGKKNTNRCFCWSGAQKKKCIGNGNQNHPLHRFPFCISHQGPRKGTSQKCPYVELWHMRPLEFSMKDTESSSNLKIWNTSCLLWVCNSKC